MAGRLGAQRPLAYQPRALPLRYAGSAVGFQVRDARAVRRGEQRRTSPATHCGSPARPG